MIVAEMPRLITPEQLLSMPDNNGMELVDGRVVEKNVSRESTRAEGAFQLRFELWLIEHAVAECFGPTLGYRCFPDAPDKVRKPDVTLIKLERLQALGDQDTGFLSIVPDLTVEVISPNDLVHEINDKVREYQNAGFPLVWVADPDMLTVTVYPLGEPPTIFSGKHDLTVEAVLPGFRCRVIDFFRRPSPAELR